MTDQLTPGQLLDAAYRERAHLVALLAAIYPSVITLAPDVDEPGWKLVFIDSPNGQLSWHISPRDDELFEHVERVTCDDPRARWDGHTTDAKYARIREHTAERAQRCGRECREGHTYRGRCELAMPSMEAAEHPETDPDAAAPAVAGLRERYAAALHKALRDYGEGDYDPGTGSDYGDQTAVAMAVRDGEVQQLRADLAALREVSRGYCPECGRGDCAPTVADWETERRRANQAEAAVARVRRFCELTADSCRVRAAQTARDVLQLLDEQEADRV